MRGQRLSPGLLGGTGVLLIAALLYGGVALRPFGPARTGPGADRQLLVLRPESSATGVPIRNIWAIRADGTGLRRVTIEAAEVLDFAVAPDDVHLVVVMRDGPLATALWRMKSDGTERTRLTAASDPAVYTDPAWSPAGDLLLYVRRDLVTSRARGAPAISAIPDVGVPRLWAMTPDGTPLKEVYGHADEGAEAPIWSPDGATVAATRYTVVGAAERGVWVVDADGSHVRELVKDATHAIWLP